MAARVYATPDDLAAYTGQPAPSDAAAQLTQASRFLDASLFSRSWYYADDTTGLPTEDVVIEAFRDATCAQVTWWQALGDSTGAFGAGYSSVSIGGVSLARTGKAGAVAPDGSESAARQIAPQVWDILQDPTLTPCHLRIGEIRTWPAALVI
jgi:hypothetical protein